MSNSRTITWGSLLSVRYKTPLFSCNFFSNKSWESTTWPYPFFCKETSILPSSRIFSMNPLILSPLRRGWKTLLKKTSPMCRLLITTWYPRSDSSPINRSTSSPSWTVISRLLNSLIFADAKSLPVLSSRQRHTVTLSPFWTLPSCSAKGRKDILDKHFLQLQDFLY